jgi:hypothetical protein
MTPLAQLGAWWKKLREDRGAWPVHGLTAFCLVFGFWLRARGFFYDVPAMWLDECTWAMMLVDLPLRDLLIRPPGFMAVSKVVAALFGPTETALRTLPWLAAVAALVLAPFLARRLFSAPAARLLFVAVIALHPCATDFAKEFKPYSLSLTLHMGLVLLTLGYLGTRRAKDLVGLLALATAGVLFSQDVVFAFPGLFGLLGWEAFRNNRRHLPAIVGCAVVIIAMLLAQYLLIWKNLPEGEADYWGEKYNVFFVPSSGVSYFSWLAERYGEVAAFPGQHRKYWKGALIPRDEWLNVRAMAYAVWLVLHVVGVLTLVWQRRVRDSVLLVLPLLVLVVFNRLGLWPFGVFRTNIFLVTYVAAIGAAALDGRALRTRSAWGLIPASLLVVIPLLFFEDRWPPTKRALTQTSKYPELLAWLARQAPKHPGPERQVVVLARSSCDAWRYYVEYHPIWRHLRPTMERHFETRCVRDHAALQDALKRALATSSRPVWLSRGRTDPFGSRADLGMIRTVQFDRHALVEYDTRTERSP